MCCQLISYEKTKLKNKAILCDLIFADLVTYFSDNNDRTAAVYIEACNIRATKVVYEGFRVN